jgi:sugar phosphate isomerase/epimerase
LKFGICSEIFKEWKDPARTIDYVKSVGYDGLEIAPFTLADYVTDIPASTRAEIRKRAQEAGLEIIGLHWLFVGPQGVHLTSPDESVRAYTTNYLRELTHCCADMGGSLLVLGSPKQRNVGRDVTYNQAFDYARGIVEGVLPALEERGVTLCMEQLTHLETNFCQTVEETVELIDAVGHPNFQLILDTKALAFQAEDRPTLLKRYAKYLRHYHANDVNLEGPGTGDVDFAPIFEALRDINFTGYTSVEVFKFERGPEAIATESIAYMKRIAAQVGA